MLDVVSPCDRIDCEYNHVAVVSWNTAADPNLLGKYLDRIGDVCNTSIVGGASDEALT